MTTKHEAEMELKKGIQVAEDLASGAKYTTGDFVQGVVDYIVEEDPNFFGSMRTVTFYGEDAKLDKIGLGARVALASHEADDPRRRRKARFGKMTVNASDVVVPFEISDHFYRSFKQGVDPEERIMRLMAKALRNDLKSLALHGNTIGMPASPSAELDFDGYSDAAGKLNDEFMTLQDGYLKHAERAADNITGAATVYDAANAAISPQMLSKVIQAMPQKYQNLEGLRFMCPSTLALIYNETFMGREDSLGVGSVGGANIPVPVHSLWPSTKFEFRAKTVELITLTGTDTISLKHKNITNLEVYPETFKTDAAELQQTAYVESTDYTEDLTNGTVTRIGAAGIGDGDTVLCVYNAAPQMLLTAPQNLITCFSLDNFTIERDRSIYRGVNQFAIRARVGFSLENPEACAIVRNIKATS